MTLFTSCDIEFWEDMEDRSEARTLDGTWTGYIDTYYYDRWGLTGDSYRTTMYFERTSAYSGWGYEVDYDLNSRYSDYYYCEFECLNYDSSFDWGYWNTRSMTRSASSDSTTTASTKVIASGKFAK